jgi:succinylglutamate desuccinylase
VDLHTTTANMGITLICVSTPGNLLIAGSVKARCPQIKIYCFPPSSGIRSTLRSIAPYGIGIEIGPIPQNVLRHDIFQAMEQVTQTLLDVVHNINTVGLKGIKLEFDAYEHVRHVSYPEGEAGSISFIHKDLQDRDYCALKQGTNLFISDDKKCITYEDTRELYPLFINEAAYYDKNIAFSLARKKRFLVNIAGHGVVFNMP